MPSQEELEVLVDAFGHSYVNELVLDQEGDLQLFRPGGCDQCTHTGYRGRTGIHEMLEATPEMKKLIAKKGKVDELRELAMQQGMRTLRQDGILKIFKGNTDWEMVRKVTVD